MRIRALVLAAIASLAVLAGCGDDKDTSTEAKTFCSVVKPVQDLGSALENADNTKTVQTAFTAAENAFNTVGSTPPSDIKTDFETVKRIFTAANDALKKASYSVDAAGAASPKAIEDLEGVEFQRAADNIQSWSTKNC
jgi:hypothetical protein